LRIETTVNEVSFFKDYREVCHRNGEREIKWTNMKKSIYSLVLAVWLNACASMA
jgi:hypothetical protein